MHPKKGEVEAVEVPPLREGVYDYDLIAYKRRNKRKQIRGSSNKDAKSRKKKINKKQKRCVLDNDDSSSTTMIASSSTNNDCFVLDNDDCFIFDNDDCFVLHDDDCCSPTTALRHVGLLERCIEMLEMRIQI